MSRVAVFQMAPIKGDRRATLATMATRMVDAQQTGARLCVFPETVVSGYFLEGGVAEAALEAETLLVEVRDAARAAGLGPAPMDVILGAYLWGADALQEVRNSALWLRLEEGEATLVARHDKIFLPTYGLFDEGRDVAPGDQVTVVDSPVGRVALLVCEDAWHSITGTIAALEGAETIIVLAASPARGYTPQGTQTLMGLTSANPAAVAGADSAAAWYRQATQLAAEHGCWVVTSHLVGVEAGRLFSGASCVVDPFGTMRLQLDPWREDWAPVQLDPDLVRAARQTLPLGRDLRARAPQLLRQIGGVLARPAGVADAATRVTRAAETTPWSACRLTPAPDPVAIDASRVIDAMAHGLRDELRSRGFSKVVLGLSGGLDSAVVAALAVRVLGPDAVTGFALPDHGSSADSLADAHAVAAHLGIQLRQIPLGAAADAIGGGVGGDRRRRGNVLARLRTTVLFDQGLAMQALPLGTGNKSERLLGYFTWHGDDAPPLNPLGDLFKTQVVAVARVLGLPSAVIDKAPSADLEPGQSDASDLGASYAELDPVLAGQIASQGERGEEGHVSDLVRQRLGTTHWKRQGATVLMLSATAIGEGYRRPRDAKGPEAGASGR